MSLSIQTTSDRAGLPSTPPDRHVPEHRTRLSGPALRTFAVLADHWRLAEAERLALLGFPARSTYHGWLKAARGGQPVTLSVDTLTRLSAVLGIHQALGTLHDREADAVAWLRRPNRATVFGGDTPLALMTGGAMDGLLTTRRFLDAAQGGLSMEPNAADAEFSPCAESDLVVE